MTDNKRVDKSNNFKADVVEVDERFDLESNLSKEYEHIFQDPAVAEHYRNVYEKCQYECRNHFDPEFTWTKEEERKVIWKNDWYITFWAFFMFTALDFDRGNISQAISDNMLGDLGLTTDDYNLGGTINLICFLASELPSQLISKKLGPDIWIPMQMTLWSVVGMAQAGLTNKAGFFVTRGLLGALQGGFICDVCLWMSYFYTTKEFPLRISIFYIANPLTSVWSSLLAFALLKIKTKSIPHGWRWLFLVEGAFTLVVGLISFFKMPASAVQTKTWFRKNGYYTDREEKIVVNRVLRDDPTKGDMNNRQPVTLKELLVCILDYDLWPVYIIRILGDIMTAPVQRYMTLTLRKLGFSTFKTNALSIPFNIISIFVMMGTSYFSELFDSRALVMSSIPIWGLSCLIPLRWWKYAQIDIWGTYALLTVVLSHSPTAPLTISWCSGNSSSVRNRVVSAAVVNMFSQAGGIIGSNIYRADDAPLYYRGNTQLVGIAFGTLGACLLSRFYYQYRNAQNKKAWNKLSPEEQEEYPKIAEKLANKRIDFKFQY